ncbi:hypothetical protein ES332_A06G000300v1 [Gossypium tomentosum]|uniref:Uncharacterized protein n=1 Tax=Gossypium tomentosum TaxID=34277 RepID=A0A5D2Q043_GOSTO|nr:hypothetical protein ES332_A06G000300v1 [Gossypium tomentosum]
MSFPSSPSAVQSADPMVTSGLTDGVVDSRFFSTKRVSFYLMLLSVYWCFLSSVELIDELSWNCLCAGAYMAWKWILIEIFSLPIANSNLPRRIIKVLKEASRLYAESWVRDIGPDLRPNNYEKDDGTEGKSNGDKRSTGTEPSTLEDIGEELYFVISYLEMF